MAKGKKIDTGGSAFSRPPSQRDECGDDGWHRVSCGGSSGMTLLDYYAGEAMKSYITETMDAACQADIPPAEFMRKTSCGARDMAEAMIAEKRRREAGQ